MLRAYRRRIRGRCSSTDDGFTLIELVVTVAIISTVLVSLVAIVFDYLQLSSETSTRLSETNDQQFLSAYWQQDVSSLGLRGAPSGGTIPSSSSVWLGSAPGCTPASGAPLVMFSWYDFKAVSTTDAALAWSGSQNYATYYTKTATNANGTTQTQLWRKRCGDTTADIIIARYLTAVPTVVCYDSSGASTSCGAASPFPATVTMSITVQDLSQAVHNATGYSNLLVTAQSRQG